jgi:hypothetical protein
VCKLSQAVQGEADRDCLVFSSPGKFHRTTSSLVRIAYFCILVDYLFIIIETFAAV